MYKAPETPEQQAKDSDQIFTAISSGDFDNYAEAEAAVAMLYAMDQSYSRAGISHALKRLEKFHRDRKTTPNRHLVIARA